MTPSTETPSQRERESPPTGAQEESEQGETLHNFEKGT